MLYKDSKILIIDDDELTRNTLAKRLIKRGYTTYNIPSAINCVEFIEEECIDLILLDNLMPDLTGIEALKIIRDTYKAMELPVIMVTSKSEPDDVVEALNLGANDFLGKPYDISIACARINNQLKIKALNRDSIRKKELETLNAAVATYNHEINNPLVIALGNLHNIEKISQKNIDKAKAAVTRIGEMVRKISTIIESGHVETTQYVDDTDMIDLESSGKKKD